MVSGYRWAEVTGRPAAKDQRGEDCLPLWRARVEVLAVAVRPHRTQHLDPQP